jgi:RNA polymerase sigma-70 factor (ECF subfamily)
MSPEQSRWLSALYEANFAAVFKRCGAILRSGEDAADAAHEVFLIALKSLAPDTDAKRARAWLLTVAQNHCVDVLRRRRRFGRVLLTLGADHDARGDLEADVVDRDFVDGVLRQLSLRERVALWQSAVEHRSLADIATGLQLSYAAAAQVVHRARQRAVRLGASIAAILAVLRLPELVRRVLNRLAPVGADGQLLAAHRVVVLAALPVIAAISLQSSTATGTAQPPPAAAVAAPGAAANSGGLTAPGGLGALLAPLNRDTDRQGAAGSAGLIPSTGIPSSTKSTLKSLSDRVVQSMGQLVSGVPAATVAPVPSASVPVPVAPTLPPVPSLPPTGP